MKAFLFALLLAPSFAFAGADVLVISHPQNDEVMQGMFYSQTDNSVEFSVHQYDSNAWDRINSADFDFIYTEWNVRLHVDGEDVTFTYHCWPSVHPGALLLFCAD